MILNKIKKNNKVEILKFWMLLNKSKKVNKKLCSKNKTSKNKKMNNKWLKAKEIKKSKSKLTPQKRIQKMIWI
jgi:hypothetical protein